MRPWYLERPAAASLRDELACTWTAEVGGEPRSLIPDACLDLLWVDDGTLLLCGPETTSWTFSLPPSTTAVGVRFRPGVAPAVLGIDASEVRDTRIRVEQLWGDRAARQLGDRIGAAVGGDARVAVLEHAVAERIARAAEPDPIAAAVAARLTDVGGPARPVCGSPTVPWARRTPVGGAASVGELARAVGLSERQLLRRCSAAFGYGPAVLARILRVQRFLALARCHGTAAGLARLALAAGYADQPHLTREVRAIAGTTPAAIVSDPFKTPGPHRVTMGP